MRDTPPHGSWCVDPGVPRRRGTTPPRRLGTPERGARMLAGGRFGAIRTRRVAHLSGKIPFTEAGTEPPGRSLEPVDDTVRGRPARWHPPSVPAPRVEEDERCAPAATRRSATCPP